MARKKNLLGQRFGELFVIGEAPSKKGFAMWKCKCDCGNTIVARANSLMTGNTTTCGCGRIRAITKHNKTGTRLFNIWRNIKERCENANYYNYRKYGGRGIKVCDEWHDYKAFEEWALANGYDETAKRGDCTIDRIDVNGNYEPSNCRWASAKEQNNNKRNTVFVDYNGERKSISEWASELNKSKNTLWWRHSKGWSPREILYGKS